MPNNHSLPDGWVWTPVHRVAQVQTGLALGRPAVNDPVTLPYLRVANVQDGYLDLEEIKEVTVEREEVGRYSLLNHDVLLTEGGDFDKLGRGCLWHQELPACLHQNHVFVVRTDTSRLDPYFFSCLTGSTYGRRYFLGCAKKSTNLASINSTQLKDMPLPLPPVNEQLAICKRLLTWDTAIKLSIKLLKTKHRLKQALMHVLFSGKHPCQRCRREEWKNEQLGDVTHPSTLRNQGRLGTEAVKAVNKSLGMIPMKERTIGASLDRYKVVRRDWFAYNPMRLNIGSLARWHGRDEALVSPDYVVFHCDAERLDPDFFDHFRSSRFWERYVESAGNGSVRVRIYFNDLARMTIKLPPLDEQQRIAEVLNTANREIGLLQRRLDVLGKQKTVLTQKLLTGRLRVKEATP